MAGALRRHLPYSDPSLSVRIKNVEAVPFGIHESRNSQEFDDNPCNADHWLILGAGTVDRQQGTRILKAADMIRALPINDRADRTDLVGRPLRA